jgi:hypothetical protein
MPNKVGKFDEFLADLGCPFMAWLRKRGAAGMLDYFCIFSKGGAMLWTWQLTALRGSPVEALIRTCLLEERSGEQSFTYKPPVGSSYTLKWTLDNVGPSVHHPSPLTELVFAYNPHTCYQMTAWSR